MGRRVLKRDGSYEDYEEAKIVRVVIAAGLQPDEAQTLATTVTQWVNGLPKEPIISTHQIRDKVVEKLKYVNEYAAGLFVWYEQTKDKRKAQKV